MYVSKSRTRAMQLKEELTMIKKGNQTVQEYLHIVKALVDKISLIDHLIADDDLTLYILNGLGSDFREIATPIREREKPLAFEELHDLLVGHDAYLRRLETTTRQLVASAKYSNRHPASSSDGQHSKANFNGQHKYTPKCQIYDELGHIAKHCPRLRFVEPTANYVPLHLQQTQNGLLILELHTTLLDKIMGAILLKGACENGVYTLPDLLVQDSPKMVANVHERTLING
ncbi:hypothetical protein CK203_094448 [Vitis vinifera]|uniref:Retrovirus-related Pol polyprotein from transposon RE1 n=1 Tax=Vitis vinifera TaxID=29760 RepID=A0A438CKW3_VITVI|nr:hypothetical protein CK203_094448 [Vitis vinifera]